MNEKQQAEHAKRASMKLTVEVSRWLDAQEPLKLSERELADELEVILEAAGRNWHVVFAL